jgi:hypothetical protein
LSALPLTHHDIVGLSEPFARSGRRVDFAASDRQERRLVFKPRTEPGDTPDRAALLETLQLDCLDGNWYRLTRTFQHCDGRQGILRTAGSNIAQLLAEIDTVPAEQHFETGPGFTIVRSYALDHDASTPSLTLTQGKVEVEGLRLTLSVPTVRRVAATINLQATASRKPGLPEDALAVLGWNWARLVRDGQGWTSRLRLRGSVVERTRKAEAALQRAAVHLAHTLAEAPAHYHDRLRAARWGVFFRRGIPTLTALSLFGAVALAARFWPDLPPAVVVALYHVPTVIVAVSFVLQELPRFEIPPWPRRLPASAWEHPTQPVAAGTDATGTVTLTGRNLAARETIPAR